MSVPIVLSVLLLSAGVLAGIIWFRRSTGQLGNAFSLLAATLESTADGILVVDRHGEIVRFNRKFVEMWHLPESILASRNDDAAIRFALDQLRHPDAFVAKIEKLYGQPEAESYDVLELTDGRVFERYSQPHRLGGRVVGRVWSFRDVTEHRQSEERFHALARDAPVGIFRTDLVGNCLYVNERWCQIAGLTPQEAHGPGWTAALHPDDRERINAAWYRAAKEMSPFRAEYRFRRPDGVVTWVFGQATAELDNGGEHVGYVGTITDITELRRLEERLRLSERLEAVGQLAGGIAHDFNNLLTAIKGYGEFLLEDLDAEDTRRHDLKEMLNAADRAAALTRQLLAFSRKQALEPRVLNLNEVVRGIENMLRRLIGEHIALSTALDPELGRVRADPGQIEQVIVNLAVNARDAMPDGGKVLIESANVALDEEYLSKHDVVLPGRYVMLGISDTGQGMDEATESRMFEPFFTTKEIGKGTGMGLATVYGIVKQSEGYIWVYSEPGHGTTFRVYLPRVDAPAEMPEGRKPLGPPPRGTESVLLVEDDPTVREMAARVLRRQGYHVLEAEDGESALEIFSRHPTSIDLLVTDAVMPRMSGKALAARVQTLYPSVRVLFVSGYADKGVADRGVIAPGVALLEKPFTPSGLARRVRDVLDAKG